MKKFLLFILILSGVFYFSCSEKPDVDAFLDVKRFQVGSVITGSEVKKPELLITSRIINTGDGIMRYGHIISVSDNQNDAAAMVKDVFSDDEVKFEDSSSPFLFEANFSGLTELVSEQTYFVWAYAMDVHQEIKNGKPLEFSIDPDIKAQFVITNNSNGCEVPCTVFFENQSENADRFIWDFGDGSIKEERLDAGSISHKYTKPGTYKNYSKGF